MQIVTKSKAKPRSARGYGRAHSPIMAKILASLQTMKVGQVLEIPLKDTDWEDPQKARTAVTGLISRSRTPNAQDEVDLVGRFACYVTEDKKHIGVECLSLEEEEE